MSKVNHNRCPLCEGPNIDKELQATDYLVSRESFELWRCSDCDFLFTQNFPDEQSIANYYSSEDYVSHSDTSEGMINKVYHTVRDIMLKRKWRLIKRLTSGKSLLDVGCGTGYFPHFMKEKGFNVQGIEVDENARKFGISNFNIQIDPPEKLFEETNKKFDVITLWHVLEHLHQLDRFMNVFHKLLKDHGYLIIAVPNHKALESQYYGEHWAGYDVPRNLWHFSYDTLNRLALKHEFNILGLEKLPFDPIYNSLLSEGYRNNSLKWITAPIIGGISLLKSFFNIKKSSSPVYILKKK